MDAVVDTGQVDRDDPVPQFRPDLLGPHAQHADPAFVHQQPHRTERGADPLHAFVLPWWHRIRSVVAVPPSGTATTLVSPVVLLLTRHAEAGVRENLEALRGNAPAALLARAVGAVGDPA